MLDRQGRYDRIYAQLAELIVGRSPDRTAAMSTICAILHAKMPHHLWTGFYRVVKPAELHVGPYQGPVACQILLGRGACVEAVRLDQPVVISDVSTFAGHITCDPRARSEIVIPVHSGGIVSAVLDIDSSEIGQFCDEDIAPLQRIVSLVEALPESGPGD